MNNKIATTISTAIHGRRQHFLHNVLGNPDVEAVRLVDQSGADIQNNLYYFEIDDEEQRRDFFPKGRSYEQWSNNGERDEGSVYGRDPMFMDVQAEDWRLRPGSPMAHTPLGQLDLRNVQEL